MVKKPTILLQKLIKTVLIIMMAIISIMHFLFAFTLVASASESGMEEIGFYINARLPENQIDVKKTYFDLRMTPSQQQDIELEIFNTSADTISVVVKINDASTNSAGEVEYQIDDAKDEILKHSLADIIVVSQSKLSIPPGSSKVITLTINMPKEEFNGELLGGVVVTKENQAKKSTGVAIVNVYSFVKGIRLTENDNEVKAELEFLGVDAKVENFRTVILHSVRNTQPTTLGDAVMNIEIYAKGSSVPKWTQEQAVLNMAPSSTMGHKIYIDPSSAVAGKYLSKVTIANEDGEWIFEQEFEISQSEAENLQATVNPTTSGVNINYILLGVSPIILIVLALIIYMIHRELKENKRSKSEAENFDS